MRPLRPLLPGAVGWAAQTGACVAAALVCAVLLAACGASGSGAGSPTATAASPGVSSPGVVSAEPTPVPSPQITSGAPPAGAVAVAARYWRSLSENRFGAARALLSPTSPMQTGWPGTDAIVRAHLVRAKGPVLWKTLKAGETVEFPVEVYVVPSYPVGNWGGPGTYVEYMGFVRMSDGTWRVMETGSGP